MPVTYYGLGANRRLKDIVFAGSHDASITGGGGNAQTQELDIAGQAVAGVRLFDLRVLARSVPIGQDVAQLVGYHGIPSEATATKTMLAGEQRGEITVADKMKAGTFGEPLSRMLTQARNFVSGTNEFLIFKFDKCTNWPLIAQYCSDILGNTIYTGGGQIARKTLDEVKGTVICVFAEKGLQEIPGDATILANQGILGFRSLYDTKNKTIKPYQDPYHGLQYFGKGGTDPLLGAKTVSGKINENIKKQTKLVDKMINARIPHSSDVLGMMYWTTTGLRASIKDRNATMWSTTGVRRMEELWNHGLEESIVSRVQTHGADVGFKQHGGVKRIRAYFPNVVMIDFADEDKCQSIYDLNHVAQDKLEAAYNISQGL